MKKIASIRRSTQALLVLVAIAASGSALAAGNAVLAIYQQPETLDPYNTNTTINAVVIFRPIPRPAIRKVLLKEQLRCGFTLPGNVADWELSIHGRDRGW